MGETAAPALRVVLHMNFLNSLEFWLSDASQIPTLDALTQTKPGWPVLQRSARHGRHPNRLIARPLRSCGAGYRSAWIA